MSAPTELVPAGRANVAPVEMDSVSPNGSSVVRSTYVRIGIPLEWDSPRMSWSDGDWEAELLRPGVRAWLGRVGGGTAGMVELEAEPNGDVGIVVFGLVPEFIGQGFGAVFLTEATRLAWEIALPNGKSVGRVWVQTSSLDHPHAIPNYESRGFKIFKTETRRHAG